MASALDICSNALVLLGGKPIASFNEDSDSAVIAANIYPAAKADVLRCHPWNCLEVDVVLSPLSAAPAFRWSHQFDLPGDLLRVIEIGGGIQPNDYRLQGRRILANTKVLYLSYIGDKNESQWDANLTDVMIKRMAKDMAYPLTKSASLAELKDAEYRVALRQAKAIDAQENPPEDWEYESRLIAVRG
jgi:hypothetical protein